MSVHLKGSKRNPYLDTTKPPAKLMGIKDNREGFYHLSVWDDFWFKNTHTGKLIKGIVVSIDYEKDQFEAYVSKKAYNEHRRVKRLRESNS